MRDKKTLLSDQCKEMKETIEQERLEISSIKLEIPRECFRQNGTIKDRNNIDITEGEDIKRRQAYTE